MTLRSLLIGDCDHYASPYIFGVAQGMARLGHWHSQISIRQSADLIEQRIRDVRPHVLWTHMLLWPPGPARVERLIEVVERAAREGAQVIIHDGDYKEPTRYPRDLSRFCALALCNHTFDRSAWRIPSLHWPYFAFAQERISPPSPLWACDLWFAGRLDRGAVYAERTKLVESLRARGVALRAPGDADGNTLYRTAEIAPSAGAVLGFGRPGVRGWIDTRVFQYPGAGAILLHDDAAGILEPGVHYLPYQSSDAASVLEALRRAQALPEEEQWALRKRAFDFVQEKHSSVARVRQVLDALGLR